MPANRVAALASILTSLGALIAATAGAFPGSTATALVAVAALVTKAVTVLKFLDGSQKYDRLTKPVPGVASPITYTSGTTATGAGTVTLTNASLTLAPDEPGDPDGLPHLPTQQDPPADGDDQVHA